MAFTEFFCRASGSNVNGGALSTGAEPSTTAAYTSTNGNWSTVTNQFTPTDGTTPASFVTVGDFASVYIDGATTAVYIARVTLVAAGANGAITLSNAAKYGTAPVTSATARTIKVGGAWLGPNAASTFPFGLSGTIGALQMANGSQTRLSLKNDQIYTMTAALPFDTLGNAVIEGYTSTAGDLGKSTFTSNITSGTNYTIGASINAAFIDLIFANTGASGTNNMFSDSSTADVVFLRCVFHGARGSGFVTTSGTFGNSFLLECEAYDCNKSNTAGQAGFIAAGGSGTMFCYNCYSHDHTSGVNAHGFGTFAKNALVMVNCVSESNGGSGVLTANTASAGLACINSNFYNNTGDGVKVAYSGASAWTILINNNFLKNTGKGVNNTVTSQGGILYNNGRGSGTQANGGSDALGNIVNTGTDITYASGVTPWNAPTTGDFSTTLAAAKGTGRGHFEENDGTNAGTLAYPDIGAARAAVVVQVEEGLGGLLGGLRPVS